MTLVRNTAVALAVAALAATASTASAAPVHVLRDGEVKVVSDPYLPAGEPQLPPTLASPAPAAHRGAAARAAAKRVTVTRALRTLRDEGAITPEDYRARARTWAEAKQSLRKLTGRREVELGAIVRSTEALASGGGLTAGRLPVVFEIVARNREWWTTGSLLAYGARARFTGSRIVWQSYPGNGLQPQWLGTFGEANAFWRSKKRGALRQLLDEAVALASPRAGGIAWESFFAFSGAPPVWVSALSQGTGIQALSRGSQLLERPDLLEAAKAALGVFATDAPEGVRVPTKAGAHYLIYSTNERLRVLNGFLQSLNGLFDYSDISGDPDGLRLFEAGDAQARVEVPQYDTGEWSLYEGSRESDLGYHQLVRQFLENLCERTAVDVYCATATEFEEQETRPPVLRIRTTRGRTKAPVPVEFSLSKISTVSLYVNDVPIASARLGRGTHTLTWAGRRKAGDVNVRLDATDLAGNKASVAKIVTLRRK